MFAGCEGALSWQTYLLGLDASGVALGHLVLAGHVVGVGSGTEELAADALDNMYS